MDSTLQSLGLPRKTIGINVTQIGLDDVRRSHRSHVAAALCSNYLCRAHPNSCRPLTTIRSEPRRLDLVFACLALRVASHTAVLATESIVSAILKWK
jgi:hypothetical protein